MPSREETWTRERCFITELVNEDAIGAFSLAIARVEPGVTTELHRLSVDEWYVIRSGRGRMEVGGHDPRPVTEGDIVAIPRGVSQRITNSGDVDLVFECVCLPRFTPDAYEPLEEH
jgi:mannose-6-phosphate isomerase-like protein (cupin superfamily)